MVGMEELHQLALRMRAEMPGIKERTVHLQTFRHTFTGQQAVAYLVSSGAEQGAAAARETCQRMLAAGLFKSLNHRDAFTADGELYRFSSSALDHKHKGLTSLTSTGLYKEIAKFGKAAAQPFKNVQVSLNDTLANLGSLSGVAPKLGAAAGAAGGGSMHARLRAATPSRKLPARRSSTGLGLKHGGDQHGGLLLGGGEAPGWPSVVAELQVLQAGIRESTSLLRLDLQQHTALQEHLVGLMRAQQDHQHYVQLLSTVAAASLAMLLATRAAVEGLWPLQALAGAMLLVVAAAAFGRYRQHRQQGTGADLLLAHAVHPQRPSLREAREKLLPGQARGHALHDTASAASVATQVGSASGSVGDGDAAAAGSGAGEDDGEDDEGGGCWEDYGPSLEDFEDWPDSPVILCPDPAATKQRFLSPSPGPCAALRLNGAPVPFESELFSGVVAVFIRHLGTTPPQLFKGKKRLTWVALQGTFKRPVSFDSLVFGQEFDRKLTNLPAPWFIDNMLLPLARKISPALRVGTLEEPYFYSPMITASQVVNVSLPGAAPPLMEACEDIGLVAHTLGSKTGDLSTVAGRRKYFQSAAARAACSFRPGHVWTFHLWQEYVDYGAYTLSLGYSSYDLTQHLDGQPLQMAVKDVSSGSYLLSLQVWHANLVRSTQRHFVHAHSARLHDGRDGAVHADHSTQVTCGGAAAGEQEQPLTPPSDTSTAPRLSDAGGAAAAALAFGHANSPVPASRLGGPTPGSSQDEESQAQQQQQHQQQQSPLLLHQQQQQQPLPHLSSRVASRGSSSCGGDLAPCSPQSECWYEARHSHSQQEPEVPQALQQAEGADMQAAAQAQRVASFGSPARGERQAAAAAAAAAAARSAQGGGGGSGTATPTAAAAAGGGGSGHTLHRLPAVAAAQQAALSPGGDNGGAWAPASSGASTSAGCAAPGNAATAPGSPAGDGSQLKSMRSL